MSQEQLNTIVKILRNGAPALATEIIDSVKDLVNDYARDIKDLEELKSAKSDDPENQKENK